MVVHAAVGAAAGQAVESSMFAFLLGVISHFFLDMIPHGDEGVYQGYVSGTKVKRAFAMVGSDAMLTVIFVVLLFTSGSFRTGANVAWGVVGGLIPDALVAISHFFRPNRNWGIRWRLDRYQAFHRWNHIYLQSRWKRFEKDISFMTGLVYQGILFFVLIKYVL